MAKTLLASLALIAGVLCASACGGGGGGSGGGSAPPPPAPPPAPPPSNVFRPTLFIETDPNGTVNIRVIERVYDPFTAPDPQRVLNNLTGGPNDIDGPQSTLITNANLNREKYGIHILGTGAVSIYNLRYVDFDGGGSIHGAAIKVERSGAGPTYIQRVFADPQETPDYTYNVSNTDFLGVEFNGQPIYVRGATARNMGDGGVDSKSTGIYLMNVTFENASRMLRAWDGVQITIVNSILNAPAASSHAWIYDNTSSVRYYNTIWCVDAVDPTPTDPDCSADPTIVEGETISASAARARMTALTSNPLPGVSPFFESQIDQIVVEYSSNGGATWQTMNLPNAGGGGREPIGDTRYRIPLNLATADYRFRAHFLRNGVQVGENSQIINESGQIVG